MKKLLFTLSLAFSVCYAQAAVNYQGFIPNKTLSLNGSALTFDLDGDMNDDITFNLSGSSSNYTLTVTGPDLQFARGNGSHSSYPEQLFIGKIVDASKTWGGLGATETIASTSGRDLAGATEFFLGLRFKSGNNYFYGWLLMELTSNLELRVKGVAFETNVNSYIVVGYTGSTFIGQEEFSLANDWQVFPTVLSDQLNIHSLEDIKSIRIFNLSGQEVYNIAPFSKQAQISLSHLAPGNYIVEAEDVKGSSKSSRFLKK